MQMLETRQTQEPEREKQKATAKQINYINMLAKQLGFHVNAGELSKRTAAQKIELFRKIRLSELQQKSKEQEVRMAMVKKLIYKKWLMHNKEISRQTEKAFMQEVCYIHRLFNKIDRVAAANEAA